MLGTQGLL